LTTSVNLLSSLNLGSNSNAILGFTAGTPGTGLTSTIQSWSVTALNSQSTTTDSSGNYNFTGLMPLSNYTITQVTPANYVQSSPFNTVGIYSETSLTALSQVVSSVASGDYNGDSIPDIAYSTSLNSGNSYQIMVAYGNGNGTFGTSTLINLPVPAYHQLWPIRAMEPPILTRLLLLEHSGLHPAIPLLTQLSWQTAATQL
jgi:hypothetical protein